MYDLFNKPFELTKTFQQVESWTKQISDFWLDIAIDTIKLYKTK